MYLPAHFDRSTDANALDALIARDPFVTLVSQHDGAPLVSHLPVLAERDGDSLRLLGHWARPNPQWRSIVGQTVLAIVHGPHAYVSPRWYQQSERVPTWNYAAVHAYGKPIVIEAREAKHAVMRRLVALQDPQWLPKFEALRPAYVQQMLDGIVPFEIEVTRLETRWKLSQNRGRREQELIIAELEKSSDSAERATAALTRRHLAGGG